jgi:lysozyme
MADCGLGDHGENVRLVQAALVRAGFDPGGIDGSFGPRTRAAVMAFQRHRGLEVDGVVGPRTRAALGIGATGAPAAPTSLSDRGVEFIARFEGFRQTLYDDPAGHCTIGYGHLVHHGRCDGSEPPQFRGVITRTQALRLLRSDAAGAAAAVTNSVTVHLTQHQFDALVSFAYNVGAGGFRRSTLLKRLNTGDKRSVRGQLALWNKAGGRVLPGLVTRRKAEAALFETGRYV